MIKQTINIKDKLFENMEKLNPDFIQKVSLNEAKEEKKWIQKADMKKGALHDRLGIPEKDEIPMSVITRNIAQLEKKKSKLGPDEKMDADDLKFLEQLNAAKNMKNIKKEPEKDKSKSEDKKEK
jgi:hypothetical protein